MCSVFFRVQIGDAGVLRVQEGRGEEGKLAIHIVWFHITRTLADSGKTTDGTRNGGVSKINTV